MKWRFDTESCHGCRLTMPLFRILDTLTNPTLNWPKATVGDGGSANDIEKRRSTFVGGVGLVFAERMILIKEY